ncbi:ABC transporter permease [Candidatus Pelagibacter sp.]|jgi:lipopolysaccharide transport system permease protein|nr:ABC transporter permease [Candidatus Pelagibacter sp.]
MLKEFSKTVEAFKNYEIWSELAFSQIRARYARTFLGPIWELLGLVLLLIPLSILWSKLWNRPINDFFIYLFSGYSLFRHISTTLGNASQNFITDYGSMIKNINLNPLIYLLALNFRNLIFFFHVLAFIFLLGIFFELRINFGLLILFLICMFITLLSVSTILSFLCIRFRDLSNIVTLVISLLFFFTPIIWEIDQISSKNKILFIDPNLLYHYIEFFRSSIINGTVNNLSFTVVLTFTLVISIVAIFILKNFRKKLVTWI